MRDCRNTLPKVGWELGVVLWGTLGGDVDVELLTEKCAMLSGRVAA